MKGGGRGDPQPKSRRKSLEKWCKTPLLVLPRDPKQTSKHTQTHTHTHSHASSGITARVLRAPVGTESWIWAGKDLGPKINQEKGKAS